MNIFEFCEKFRISISKARKMDKAGVLRLDENMSDEIMSIRHSLSRGQPLSAPQLVYFIDTPGAAMDLGRYSNMVLAEMQLLGEYKREIAPKEIVAYVTDAAKGDNEAVNILIDWIKKILPNHPVGHNYIAVRLMLGLVPNIRKYDAPRVPRALLNCRRHENFRGFWKVEKRGSRNVTIYCRPTKKELAFIDL